MMADEDLAVDCAEVPRGRRVACGDLAMTGESVGQDNTRFL